MLFSIKNCSYSDGGKEAMDHHLNKQSEVSKMNSSNEIDSEPSSDKRAIIIGEAPSIYQDAQLTKSLDVPLLPDSEMVISTQEGKAVKVILPGGQHGYIDGETVLNFIRRSWLASPQADIYTDASSSSPVMNTYQKGDEFEMLNVIEQNGKEWVRIRDLSGKTGFLKAKVKVITEDSLKEAISKSIGAGSKEKDIVKTFVKQGVPEPIVLQCYRQVKSAIDEYATSDEGRKMLAAKHARHMLYGVLWMVGGTIATVIGYSSASESGGSYYIFWGAVVFGAYDFLKGLFGWIKYSS